MTMARMTQTAKLTIARLEVMVCWATEAALREKRTDILIDVPPSWEWPSLAGLPDVVRLPPREDA